MVLDGERYTDGGIAYGTPRVAGTLSGEAFLEEADRKKPGLLFCYDLDGKNGDLLWGNGELYIQVDDDGQVIDAKWVEHVPGQVNFSKCAKRVMTRWSFGAGPATVSFPMSLTTSVNP